MKYNNVEQELKELFAVIEPTQREIYDYLDKFLNRYKLNLADYTPGMNGFEPIGENGGNDG